MAEQLILLVLAVLSSAQAELRATKNVTESDEMLTNLTQLVSERGAFVQTSLLGKASNAIPIESLRTTDWMKRLSQARPHVDVEPVSIRIKSEKLIVGPTEEPKKHVSFKKGVEAKGNRTKDKIDKTKFKLKEDVLVGVEEKGTWDEGKPLTDEEILLNLREQEPSGMVDTLATLVTITTEASFDKVYQQAVEKIKVHDKVYSNVRPDVEVLDWKRPPKARAIILSGAEPAEPPALFGLPVQPAEQLRPQPCLECIRKELERAAIVAFPPSERISSGPNQHCDITKGEYLNVCGECVGGSTEKDDTFGVDACGVCNGNNACLLWQDPCSSVDDNELADSKQPLSNCTKILGLSPKIVDKAVVGTEASVFFYGYGLEEEFISNLTCSVKQVSSNVYQVVLRAGLYGSVLEVRLALPGSEAVLVVECRGSPGLQVSDTFSVVDSSLLQPLVLQPASLPLGHQTQVTLKVANMFGLADIVCFARDESSGQVEYVSSAVDVHGNRLETTVTCPQFRANLPAQLNFGVAYSFEPQAVYTAKTLSISLVARAPVLRSATLSSEKTVLALSFDQNIDGPTDCSKTFNKATTANIGLGAVCKYSGNQMEVQLGKGSRLTPGQEVGLEPGNSIHPALASPGEGPSAVPLRVRLGGRMESVTMASYRLQALPAACSQGMRQVQVLSDDPNLTFEWSLGFSLAQSTAQDTRLTPGGRQRKNLQLWRTVRQMQKSWNNQTSNSVQLNSTLMSPGVEYVISVVGKDQDGRLGPEVKLPLTNSPPSVQSSEQRQGGNQVEVQLLGPESTSSMTSTVMEAQVSTCTPGKPDKYRVAWSVKDGQSSLGALELQQGSKLRLDPGTLRPNGVYTVTATVQDPSGTTLATATKEINVKPTTIALSLPVQSVSVGTGYALDLDASKTSLPGIPSTRMQFEWKCRGESGACLSPGPDGRDINTEKDILRKSVLHLPAGKLPVGKYWMTVNGSLGSGEWGEATTQVEVIPGSPPLLTFNGVSQAGVPVGSGQVNPALATTLHLSVQHLAPAGQECLLRWDSVNQLGYGSLYLSDGTNFRRVRPQPGGGRTDDQEVEIQFPLELRVGSLRPDTRYKLEATADCGSNARSSVVVAIETGLAPSIPSFIVDPRTGVALQTRFQFRANFQRTQYNQPVWVRFGYRTQDANAVDWFYEGTSDQAETDLPPGDVLPMVELCNVKGICTQAPAPAVPVKAPSSISDSDINSILNAYQDLLLSNDYNGALTLMKRTLSGVKQATQKPPYNKVSERFETALKSRMDFMTQRIQPKYEYIASASSLLDSATASLPLTSQSESSTAALIALRDKLRSALRTFTGASSEGSPELPVEPRPGPGKEPDGEEPSKEEPDEPSSKDEPSGEEPPKEEPPKEEPPKEEPPKEEPPKEEPPKEEPPKEEPPKEEPPKEEPPKEEPPEEEPSPEEPSQEETPGEEPPAEQPPAEESSAEQPSAEEPPAEQPPAEEPPAEQPPAEEPSDGEPPAEETPAEEPPAEQPPAEEPPAEETPAEEPSAEQPSPEEPPAEQPPAEEPPAEETPAEEPPGEETPDEGQQPSAEQPSNEETPAEENPDQGEPEGEGEEETPANGEASPDEPDDETRRRKRHSDKAILTRSKRQTMGTSPENLIKTLLATSALVILNSTDTVRIEAEKKALVSQIDEYLVELCTGLMDSTPLYAGSRVASLSATRIRSRTKINFNIPDCSGRCVETVQGTLGKSTLDKVSTDDGICIGGVYFPTDILTSNPGIWKSWSRVFGLQVLSYKGSKVERLAPAKKSPQVVLRMITIDKPLPAGYAAQCHRWISGIGWTPSGCRTLRTFDLGTRSYIECKCSLPGYYKLFAMPKAIVDRNGEKPPVKKPLPGKPTDLYYEPMMQPTLALTAVFKLNGNYANALDPGRRREFETSLRTQILNQITFSEPLYLEAFYFPDGIVLQLHFYEYATGNKSDIGEELSKRLSQGQLHLLDLQGQPISVPIQQVQLIQQTTADEQDAMQLLVVIIVIGFTGFLLLSCFLLTSTIFKWRQESKRNKHQEDPTNMPKYLKLEDEESFETLINQVGSSASSALSSGIILSVQDMRSKRLRRSSQRTDSEMSAIPGATSQS